MSFQKVFVHLPYHSGSPFGYGNLGYMRNYHFSAITRHSQFVRSAPEYAAKEVDGHLTHYA